MVMKINIWIHKDDIESGNITKWYNCREKIGGDWPDYYQITINKDEFFKLLDDSNDEIDEYFKDEEAMIIDNDERNKFLVEQYNRNRDIEDHISDINEIRNTA